MYAVFIQLKSIDTWHLPRFVNQDSSVDVCTCTIKWKKLWVQTPLPTGMFTKSIRQNLPNNTCMIPQWLVDDRPGQSTIIVHKHIYPTHFRYLLLGTVDCRRTNILKTVSAHTCLDWHSGPALLFIVLIFLFALAGMGKPQDGLKVGDCVRLKMIPESIDFINTSHSLVNFMSIGYIIDFRWEANGTSTTHDGMRVPVPRCVVSIQRWQKYPAYHGKK